MRSEEEKKEGAWGLDRLTAGSNCKDWLARGLLVRLPLMILDACCACLALCTFEAGRRGGEKRRR